MGSDESSEVSFFKDDERMIYVCESHRLGSLWEFYAVFPAPEVTRAGNRIPLSPSIGPYNLRVVAPVEERRKHDCSSRIGAQFGQSWSASH